MARPAFYLDKSLGLIVLVIELACHFRLIKDDHHEELLTVVQGLAQGRPLVGGLEVRVEALIEVWPNLRQELSDLGQSLLPILQLTKVNHHHLLSVK